LHEPFPDSELGHDFFVIALQKKTTLVPEDLGFEKQDSGKSAGSSFHKIGLIDSANVMVTSFAFIVRNTFLSTIAATTLQ
jgi:hypothetical protein